MSEIKLLLCPFCGGEARLKQVPTATYDGFVVTCGNKKCCAFYIGYGDEGLYETREKAVAAWNTRKPMDQIIEKLKERHKVHEENLKECHAQNNFNGAVKESCMKTENEISIEIVAGVSYYKEIMDIDKKEGLV